MRKSHSQRRGKKRATSGSLKNVRINKGMVNGLQGFTKDDDKEWGISWNKETPEKVYIIYGNETGVEFYPSREVNIHTHHDRVVSQPSAVDMANVIDAKEMVSIITTPYGMHIFRKGKEDRRTNYNDAIKITKQWVNPDYTIDNLKDKMAQFGIEYTYMNWKEAEEKGIDIDKIFKNNK